MDWEMIWVNWEELGVVLGGTGSDHGGCWEHWDGLGETGLTMRDWDGLGGRWSDLGGDWEGVKVTGSGTGGDWEGTGSGTEVLGAIVG